MVSKTDAAVLTYRLVPFRPEHVDLGANTVRIGTRKVRLGPRQAECLYVMAEKMPEGATTRQILERMITESDEPICDVAIYVRRLRNNLAGRRLVISQARHRWYVWRWEA